MTMRIDYKIIEEIAETAHDLLFGENTDYCNLPNYLKAFGVNIGYAELENDMSGYLRADGENPPQIVVNVNDSKSRQLFTMAHELGHLLLHYKWSPGKDVGINDIVEVTMYRNGTYQTKEQTQKEVEANQFAAAFLMPKSKVAKLIIDESHRLERKLEQSEAIVLISSTFGVSQQAASIRLKNILKG
ncbi:ImmA/IrrE family metallo-endopeptidase [Enterococcus wangshanyuanii]|uniref:IrrE N-terminal-like domain-containing protein n=1 Tax=Enterococcus wangshanyuanii TaxID=2005703 RepID=A0ABQ1PRX0_9ENTE|nr:ImmA/IrrE family metallo-endopeptidase [Enterococcus wangshanyuanii]GGD02456.1 hypothetical protein GCM10011573_34850 [Enterococcus wangshanyuanii]